MAVERDPARCRNNDLLVDFEPSYGIWLRQNDALWVLLHGTSSRNLASGDVDGDGRADPLIDCGPGHGLWIWKNNGSWQQIHQTSAVSILGTDLEGNGKSDYVALAQRPSISIPIMDAGDAECCCTQLVPFFSAHSP